MNIILQILSEPCLESAVSDDFANAICSKWELTNPRTNKSRQIGTANVALAIDYLATLHPNPEKIFSDCLQQLVLEKHIRLIPEKVRNSFYSV